LGKARGGVTAADAQMVFDGSQASSVIAATKR